MRKNIVVGEYRFKVSEYYDKAMPNHESAQCGLMFNSNIIMLKSYSTIVATYNTTDNSICCAGTYSATTRKHIGYFAHYINERYGTKFTYQDFKTAAGE